MWTLAYGDHEDRTPTHGYEATREAAMKAFAKSWRRGSLNAEYAKIWPNITVKKAPPPDSKEWEGKPDKLQYFLPNPGAGD